MPAGARTERLYSSASVMMGVFLAGLLVIALARTDFEFYGSDGQY